MRVANLILICFAAFLFSAGLTAQNALGQEDRWVTNLGRNVLSQADAVVTGVIGKQPLRTGSSFQRELLVQEVIWGSCKHVRLTVMYADERFFRDDDFRVALAVAFDDPEAPVVKVVGGRTPLGNPATLRALQAYLDLERSREPLLERALDLKVLIEAHLTQGGVAGAFAGVELMFMVRNHPQVFAYADYERLLQLADKQGGAALRDTVIAMRHLVLWTLKPMAQAAAMRAPTQPARMEALTTLELYFRRFPETFGEEDDARLGLILEYLPEEATTRVFAMQARLRELVLERANRQGNPGLISRANITGTSETVANPAWERLMREAEADVQPINNIPQPIEERTVKTSPSAEEEHRKRREAKDPK